MSSSLVQAQTISIINSKIVNARDLPANYNNLAIKWLTTNKQILMATEFASFWVIVKTSGTSSVYNMYCGNNVLWNNTHYNTPDKLPDLILVIENSEFKGILIDNVITELVQLGLYGIFTWMSPITPSSSSTSSLHHIQVLVDSLVNPPRPAPQTLMQFMQNAGSLQQPMAYIQAGNTLIPVPHGTSMQLIPNQLSPMMNISHYRRC